MNLWRGAVGAVALALAAGTLFAPIAAAAPGGPSFFLGGIRLSPTSPFEGDNVTVLVDIVNNASTDVVLSNLTVTVAAAGSPPALVGQSENITAKAASNTTIEFHWLATGGTRTLTAQASLRQGNASIPLPPISLRTTVEKPQIQEPLSVAAGIGAVFAALLLVVAGPAVWEVLKPEPASRVVQEGPITDDRHAPQGENRP